MKTDSDTKSCTHIYSKYYVVSGKIIRVCDTCKRVEIRLQVCKKQVWTAAKEVSK